MKIVEEQLSAVALASPFQHAFGGLRNIAPRLGRKFIALLIGQLGAFAKDRNCAVAVLI
jgi:hypothetical protein